MNEYIGIWLVIASFFAAYTLMVIKIAYLRGYDEAKRQAQLPNSDFWSKIQNPWEDAAKARQWNVNLRNKVLVGLEKAKADILSSD